MTDDPLLSVRGLTKHYPTTEGVLDRETGRVRAVDAIDFDLYRGETLGLVGESGCGKSTAARTLLHLEAPTAGEVVFDGEDLTGHTSTERKCFRRRAGMIFQDPTSSFDPRMSIGEAVAEPAAIHGLRDRERRRDRVKSLLERVGLSAADYDRYPHELSGGQKQRVALARALVLNPALLVADEPVSALDVSIQAEILDLMADLGATFDLSILLITHDMNVVRDVCDRVAVMYLGEVVEIGPTSEVFADPKHPYTEALLASVPTPDPAKHDGRANLAGEVPDPADPPTGCRFHTRCPAAIQPEGYDFDQTIWRDLLDLRIAVRDRTLDVEALRERLVAEGGATSTAEVSKRELRTAVRGAFGVPDELGDSDAERVVSGGISAVVDGEFAAATERFGAFSTVCERKHPNDHAANTEGMVSCHRYDTDR